MGKVSTSLKIERQKEKKMSTSTKHQGYSSVSEAEVWGPYRQERSLFGIQRGGQVFRGESSRTGLCQLDLVGGFVPNPRQGNVLLCSICEDVTESARA